MSLETRQYLFYRSFYYVLVLSVLGLVVGCNRTTDSIGQQRPAISLNDGSEHRAWNQQPHGGADEKSNNSPCESLE